MVTCYVVEYLHTFISGWLILEQGSCNTIAEYFKPCAQKRTIIRNGCLFFQNRLKLNLDNDHRLINLNREKSEAITPVGSLFANL